MQKIQAILQGVDNVQSFGKHPDHMINCITFTKPIAKDVENTIRYFFEKKGMRTCLTQLCPTGLAEDRLDLLPDRDDIKRACSIRDKINYPGSNLSISSMDTNKYYCGGIICITVGGDVTPCSVIRQGVGNIYSDSLEKIIEENREILLFTRMHDTKKLPERCTGCPNNVVCWGCRAAAFYTYGDVFAHDPNCHCSKTI